MRKVGNGWAVLPASYLLAVAMLPTRCKMQAKYAGVKSTVCHSASVTAIAVQSVLTPFHLAGSELQIWSRINSLGRENCTTTPYKGQVKGFTNIVIGGSLHVHIKGATEREGRVEVNKLGNP